MRLSELKDDRLPRKKNWAVEMDTVEKKFRKLLKGATVSGEPLSGGKIHVISIIVKRVRW